MNKLKPQAKVLVTGGAGFIGSHIVYQLIEKGLTPVVIDDLSTGTPGNLPSCVEFIQADVMDRELLNRIKSEVAFVFHAAGVVGMRLATKAATSSYELATLSTRVLLELYDVPIVLFSSSAVYAYQDNMAVNETQIASYDDLLKYDGGVKGYACGKHDLERIATEYSHERKVLIVRPFNVIGPRQVGNYGMVVPTFIEQAIDQEDITLLDDGEQRRCFSYIDDFVEALMRLAACEKAFMPGSNVFNIGTPQVNSVLDLALTVKRLTASQSKLTFQPYEEVFTNREDVRFRKPNISRLEASIGKVRWRSLEESLHSILECQRTA